VSGQAQSPGVDDRQIWEYLVNSTGSDVLIRSDAAFVIEWISPSVRRLLGFGPDELVGVTLGDLIHPDDIVPNGRSRDGGEVVYFRGRLRRFDGSYRWVESRSQPTRDANGRVTGYVGLARDIDAEVRPPTESAWTGGLLEAVTDGMMDPQGIVKSVRDEHGTIVDFVHLHANQALCEFLGVPRGQVIGRSLHHVFTTQLMPEAVETGVRIVEGGSSLILDDFPMPNANGEAWVSARATKLGDGFIYTFRDVTAAHRAARPGGGPRRGEHLPRTQGGVHAFMAAMSTAPIGVCLVDPDTGRFLEVNPALCRILGRTPEELATCTWREITHPDDVDIDAHLLHEMLAGRREGFRRRKRYLRPDGATVWADIFVSDSEAGLDSRTVVGHVVDVTVEVVAQQEAREATERVHAVVDTSADAIALMRPVRDASGQVVDFIYSDVNQALCERSGKAQEYYIGRSVLDVGDSDNREELLRIAIIAMRTGQPIAISSHRVTLTGTGATCYFDVSVVPAGDMISVTIRDVTTWHDALQRARATEEHLRAVLSRMPSPHALAAPIRDSDGAIVDFEWVSVNEAAGEALGVRPEDLVGRRHSELVPSSIRTPFHEAAAKAMNDGGMLSMSAPYPDFELTGRDEFLAIQAIRVDDVLSVTFSLGEPTTAGSASATAAMDAYLPTVSGSASTGTAQDRIAFDGLVIDFPTRAAILNGADIELTRLEFAILTELAGRPRVVRSADDLFRAVQGVSWVGDAHTIEVHLSRLRQKLGEDGRNPGYIKNKRGFGYFFDPDHRSVDR